MAIKSFALVQPSSGLKLSKEKTVSLILDRKNEKSYKFDGAYNIESSVPEIYGSHISTHINNLASGYNASIASFTQASTETNGFQSGLMNLSLRDIFQFVEKLSAKNEFLVSVSMLKLSKDGQCTDLISPHGRGISLKHHSKHGMYAEGLSQLVCPSAADAIRLYDDGCQATTAMKLHPYLTCFTVQLFQRTVGTTTQSSTAYLKFVDFNAEKKSFASVSNFLSTVAQKKGKVGRSDQRPAVEDILMDVLLGNSNVTLLAAVGGQDAEEINSVLSIAESLSGLGAAPKISRDDPTTTLHQLRQEISKVRDKLAGQSPPNKGDISAMERLMGDLEETKRTGWDQTILRSEQFYEERKTSFSNKGLLWILESTKTASRESVKKLESLKGKLTEEYKDQRQVTERLNSDVKQQIDSYTQLINSGQSGDKKAHVAAISELKDQHKRESDKLKEIRNKLKDVQDKLQVERQGGMEESFSTFDVAFQSMVAERERTQRENQQLIEDELERMKIEVAHEKTELQMKFTSKTLIKSDDDVLKHETELAQLRSEKNVMTTQLDLMKRERAQMEDHMKTLAEKHSRELEIQQLQNLQTFRAYREVFEEFKKELENRWRGLLDDAIQDAVFLNSRNSELMENNARLKHEIAKLKDDRSINPSSKTASKI